MLRQILSTTWKDLKILFTDTGGLATLFLMPLMFIIVMSTALQGLFDTGTDTQPRRLPVVNLDRGEYAAAVIEALDGIDGIELKVFDSQDGYGIANAINQGIRVDPIFLLLP